MAAPTVTVSIDLSAMIGEALEGVEIRATLDRNEVYGGFIIGTEATATTDASGIATMELFPNALPDADLPGLGTQGSVYRFTSTTTTGRKLDVLATIPNQDCNLHSVILPEDAGSPNPGLLQGSVRYDVAQTLTTPQQAQARSNIGFVAAVLATALAGLSTAAGGTITSADTVLQAFGKIEHRLTDLEDGGISGPYTITANSSSPTLTLVQNGAGLALSTAGQITAGQFNGPLVGNVTGNVTGNAGTVTNGVYTTGSYADPNWLTSVAGSKVTGNIAGNAGTATTLATARTINGVSFNGSADITVTAAAGTLTGTTLAAGVTASSLTSVGTLTSLAVAGATTLSGGTANGVAYLNGSKVLTTGTGLQFDGMNLGVGVDAPIHRLSVGGPTGNGISYNDGTVISYQGTTGSNKVLIGSLTNHPVDIISNIVTVASFSSSGVAVTSGNLGIGYSTFSNAAGASGRKIIVGDAATSATPAAITVYSGAATYGGVYFADGWTGDQAYRGYVEYNHATDTLSASAAGGAGGWSLSASGFNVTGIQTITANSSSAALTITQSGAGPALVINGLPTSAAGLPTGAVWNDSGTLKVA